MAKSGSRTLSLLLILLASPVTFGQAMFGYALNTDGTIVDPQPLDGATVEARQSVYMTWVEPGAVIKYWCCKLYAPDGATLVPHWIEGLEAAVIEVDLSGQSLSTGRELYADFYFPVENRDQLGNFANFSIGETTIPAPVLEQSSVMLSWTAPLLRVDGSPLTDLAGYNIYIGEQSGMYTTSVNVPDPGVTVYEIENLEPATYYFAVTAYTDAGLESGYSNEVSKAIEATPEPAPNSPTGLDVWQEFPVVGDLVVGTNTDAWAFFSSRNAITPVWVGTVPTGTACDPTQGVNGMYVVPVEVVDLDIDDDGINDSAPEAIVALCSRN